ncbi:MAG: outer membrane protein assembly factor BamB, partial [Pirellulaceae bacterium]
RKNCGLECTKMDGCIEPRKLDFMFHQNGIHSMKNINSFAYPLFVVLVLFSTLSLSTLSLSTLSPSTTSLNAQEWARFRGTNGEGFGKGKFPAKFTEADYNWKTKLPGIGHSSPVVWGDKIFLISADQASATRYILCHSTKNGKQLWKREYKSSPHHLHSRSSYASCTPAVDADHVYVAWSTPEKTTLLALDHEGKDVWDLDLGPWVSQHGFGTSPLLYKDMVILNNSQQEQELKEGEQAGKSFVMAFDRATGQERWRKARQSVRVCYSVPMIMKREGQSDELICCNTGDGVYSLNPMNGDLNWEMEPFAMRTVASPITAGGLIIGSTGSGGGGNYLVAVRPNDKIVYKIDKLAPYVPTPVAKGDIVFLWYDKGMVTCIDAKDGKVHWRERVGGGFSGSPVLADDKIYCIDEAGTVVVLAASTEYKLLARNELGEDSRSTPAISDGRMYLRTYSHLISIGDGS